MGPALPTVRLVTQRPYLLEVEATLNYAKSWSSCVELLFSCKSNILASLRCIVLYFKSAASVMYAKRLLDSFS